MKAVEGAVKRIECSDIKIGSPCNKDKIQEGTDALDNVRFNNVVDGGDIDLKGYSVLTVGLHTTSHILSSRL